LRPVAFFHVSRINDYEIGEYDAEVRKHSEKDFRNGGKVIPCYSFACITLACGDLY